MEKIILISLLSILINLQILNAKANYKVTMAIQPPFIEKYRDDAGTIAYRGYLIDLIREIATQVDFQYEIYEVPDGKFGSFNRSKPDEWTGVIRELIDKKADIGLAPLVVMTDRAEYVDFTVPFYDYVGISLLMRTKEATNDYFLFFKVYQLPAWGLLGGLFLFVVVGMYFFERVSPHSYRNNKHINDPTHTHFGVLNCVWYCLMLWAPQGAGNPPRNASSRIFLSSWWIIGYIGFGTMTSNLAAMLFVPTLEQPIVSIDDLAEQYKIQFAPIAGSPGEHYFRRMAKIETKFNDYWSQISLNESLSPAEQSEYEIWDHPVTGKYNHVWLQIQASGLPTSVEEGIKRVEDSKSPVEGFALIADSTVARYAEMTNCKVEQVGEEFSSMAYSLAVQKGSELGRNISIAILKLRNFRILDNLKKKWWDENPNTVSCAQQKNEADGIQLDDMAGLIMIVCVFLVITFIASVVEIWYEKSRKKWNTDVHPIAPNQFAMKY